MSTSPVAALAESDLDGNFKVEFINCEDFSKTKFGDIYRDQNNALIFYCSHCDQEFDSDTITVHIDRIYGSSNCIETKSSIELNTEYNGIDEAIDKHSKSDGSNKNVSDNKEFIEKKLSDEKTTAIKCNYCEAKFVCHGVKEQHKFIHGVKLKQNFCTFCASSWQTKSLLNQHIERVHKSEKPVFTCTYCSMAFATNNELLAHTTAKRLTKSGEASQKRRINCPTQKTYPCAACTETFDSKRAQREHFIVHGEKPFKCTECKYTCRRLPSLTEHMRQHTGDKPYLCDICGKGFPNKTYVNIHMRMHSGEKPYRCNSCDQSFAISWQLSRHVLNAHTKPNPKHVCDICGKGFKWPLRLVEHKRIHSGEKPYKCTICDKSFPRQNTCRLHIRLHKGERPFKCRYCELAFKHSSGRIVHEKYVHSMTNSAADGTTAIKRKPGRPKDIDCEEVKQRRKEERIERKMQKQRDQEKTKCKKQPRKNKNTDDSGGAVNQNVENFKAEIFEFQPYIEPLIKPVSISIQ